MKKILKYIPGFRSRTPKKMLIGGLYYLFSLLFITAGLLPVIAMLVLPFAIFNLVDAIKYKKIKLFLTTIGLFTVFFIGVGLSPSHNTNKNSAFTEIASTIPSASPTAAAPTAITTAIITETPANDNSDDSVSSIKSDQTVYIGNTGNKYHKKSCSTLKENGHEISLDTAISQGRTACKRCKP